MSEAHENRVEGEDRPARAATDGAASPAKRSVPRARVLLIDDEERLATTLRIALSPVHDVDVATRGAEALRKIRERDYEIILCDLALPDISGPDVFEEIERSRPEVARRFVFLTGGAFTDRSKRFLAGVENARLEKPFDLATLEALIAERLESFRGSA